MTEARALCTIGVGPHERLLAHSVPSFERYAVRHGFDLVVRTDLSGLGDRPPSWARVPLIIELLERYETVVWIDADAMVVDPTDDITAQARARPLSLVFHEIDGVSVPNLGVVVARRSEACRRLLRDMWHRTDLLHHRWWENAALIAVLGGDPDVGLVTRRSRRRARWSLGALPGRWNSVDVCPAEDPAIVHLAGVGGPEREARLAALAARAAGAAQPR